MTRRNNMAMAAIMLPQPIATFAVLGLRPVIVRRRRFPPELIGRRVEVHSSARPVRLLDIAEAQRNMTIVCRAGADRLKAAGELLTKFWANRELLPVGSALGTAVFGKSYISLSGADEWEWPVVQADAYDAPRPVRGGLWLQNLEVVAA